MYKLQDFLAAPTVEGLNELTKEQLCKVVEHFNFEVAVTKSTKLKALRDLVKEKLVERMILTVDTQSEEALSPESTSTPLVMTGVQTGLTFEQQLELLNLQSKERELDRQLELEKMRVQEREHERQFEKFKSEQRIQEVKLAQEAERLKIVAEGKIGSISVDSSENLDTFFTLFESVAEDRGWNDAERTLLLQSVLEGKAQDVFISLSPVDRRDYKIVKDTILKAYELVPEAYRRGFRGWRKGERQTHVEVARELTNHFNRWCTSLGVSSFDSLCDLVILEQFKNIIPERIATYINEQKVKTAAEAAVLADEFVLIHKNSSGYQKERNYDNLDRSMSNVVCRPKKVDPNSSCRYCLEKGHWKKECPVLRGKFKSSTKAVGFASIYSCNERSCIGEISVGKQNADEYVGNQTDYSPFITMGFVSLVNCPGKVSVKILRDTGSSESFILDSKLKFSSESSTGNSVLIQGIGLEIFSAPLHKIQLESDLVNGEVEIALRPSLPVKGVDLILGNNLAGNRVWRAVTSPIVKEIPTLSVDSDVSARDFPDVFVSCAVTRATSAKINVTQDKDEFENLSFDPLANLSLLPPSISRDELIEAQGKDAGLTTLFAAVQSNDDIENAASGYFIKDGVLVRKWTPCSDHALGEPIFQIVIPEALRGLVLKTAHGDVAGHLGVKKTYHSVMRYFFWPRLKKDVASFIKTCHTCQIVGKPNEVLSPAPLYPIPVVSTPFEHLTVDCVGPLSPSKAGSTYLLTVMCQATRYPAAYPLRKITTRAVVKALSQFISVFGIPKIIQTDRGTNFTSRMFAQVLQQLRVNHRKSTSYHPESQGSLERFHQTLKQLLKAYCNELNKDWEEGLPWLMLAAREVVQESLGFSPNDLVFGHKVRGPLALLMNDAIETETPVNLLDYVNGFRRRLYLAGKLARENLCKAQLKMKTWFDRRSERREFSPGDQVLMLLPVTGSSFLARFTGPYSVLKRVSDQNYIVSTPDRRKATQLCHVNLLKPYFCRAHENAVSGTEIKPAALVTEVSTFSSGTATVSTEDEKVPSDCIIQPRLLNSEQLTKLDVMLAHLSKQDCQQLIGLITDFPSLFSDTPSCTDLIHHDIDVGNSLPVQQRFYRVSPDKQEILEAEVKYLLNAGLAKPSCSSWASPCILVAKPDKTYRFCTDYRKLNSVTKPDLFPLPRVEDCVDSVGSAKFVTKIDLLKGYYQVPLTPRAQEVSAFITPSGLYSYNVMSFGLRNAPATFQRLMNRVVAGLEGCAMYLDDVVVYSQTWDEHLRRLRALFVRFAKAKLTINLAKCEFVKATVTYLGKVVGQGEVRLIRDKVCAVDRFPAPSTKKELMRFLGMIGYYRSFCANFSTVVAPLTDLLKSKRNFEWTANCQRAFDNAKLLLSTAPVLVAPRWDRAFQIQVDASQVGAGAVLLQKDDDGVDRPVSFFSKKFNSYQLNYSTIEKETLALVWALQHFDVYIGGGSMPVVVFSDHNPLTFLQSLRSPNQRLIRWALLLQPYSLDIRHIRGRDNVMADALSRSPAD
ncbi:hypothetical protein M9458_054263 [Cirrhinus mrigala]|uniref:Gypsy retrotransposon integrase-like protein 1 n=1 Tax=Cirrhinus mrigala TaxID=683832 RepID=A0ABD0MNE6_CIRMR